MSTTTGPSLNAEETAAVHRAADANRRLAMTIGRPMAAAKTPMQAGQPDEPTTMMLVDKAVTVTLQDGSRVAFAIGLQPVPNSLARHWFVEAHGFKRYGPGPLVGQEPERDPELPPRPGPALDEAVAEQLQQQSAALIDAKTALADKDAELAELKAKLAAQGGSGATGGDPGAGAGATATADPSKAGPAAKGKPG